MHNHSYCLPFTQASDLTVVSEDGKDESIPSTGGDPPRPAQSSTGSGSASPAVPGSVEGEMKEKEEQRKVEEEEEVKEEIEEELPGETTFIIEGDS